MSIQKAEVNIAAATTTEIVPSLGKPIKLVSVTLIIGGANILIFKDSLTPLIPVNGYNFPAAGSLVLDLRDAANPWATAINSLNLTTSTNAQISGFIEFTTKA